MALYKDLIDQMYEKYEPELKRFEAIHKRYELNQKGKQVSFNAAGAKIIEIMRDYEKKLCGKSERSGMGVYSSRLAEAYWKEIKKRFPLIDFVGVRIEG